MEFYMNDKIPSHDNPPPIANGAFQSLKVNHVSEDQDLLQREPNCNCGSWIQVSRRCHRLFIFLEDDHGERMHQECTSTVTPKDRMSSSAWYHPQRGRQGQFYSTGGHYLKEDVSLFYAPFFALPVDEASALDPLQRHLLEVTYVALENAGIALDSVRGTNTSVHVCCMGNDYRDLLCKDIETSATYDGLGANVNMNANRVSWFFDLRGTKGKT